MDPQDLLSLKFGIILDIPDHKPDQIQELLSADEKVHAHHHIKMADQFSRIIPLTLKLKKFHQRLSGRILDPDSLPEFFFLKISAKAVFQFFCKVFQLVCQIVYRFRVISVRNIQKSKGHSLFLLQIPESVQIPVAGKRSGYRVFRHRNRPAVNSPYKSFMVRTQGRRNSRILGIIDKEIFQMISAEIAGKTFDRKCLKPETADQLRRGKNVSPYIALRLSQGICHQRHHHSFQLLISFGNTFLWKKLCTELVSLKSQEHLFPALARMFHGLFLYMINIFICDPHPISSSL